METTYLPGAPSLRPQALKETTRARLAGMDLQDTLGLEGLGLEAEKRKPGKNARRRAKRTQARQDDEDDAIEDVFPGQKGPQESLSRNPSQTPSYQPLSIQPLGISPTAPKQRMNTNQNDVVIKALRQQAGQGVTLPAQRPSPFQFQASQSFTPINLATTLYQYNLQAEAPTFVPRGPSSGSTLANASPVAAAQRVSLYTQASPVDTLKPVRSEWRSNPAQRGSQTFMTSSSDARAVDCLPNLKKQGRAKYQHFNNDELIPLPAPIPSKQYISKSYVPPTRLFAPQRLLLVLDLNGTLLYRTARNTKYIPRPALETFLSYAFANHSVLIWSSAKPKNVTGICQKLFTPERQSLLLGAWGRDTLGLTPAQYDRRVQVYKHLDSVWENEQLQQTHPDFAASERWGQHNTVLIDDSAKKAAAQPYNHMEVPEFVGTEEQEGDGKEVLSQVMGMLEEVRRWSDVSAFMKARGTEKGQDSNALKEQEVGKPTG